MKLGDQMTSLKPRGLTKRQAVRAGSKCLALSIVVAFFPCLATAASQEGLTYTPLPRDRSWVQITANSAGSAFLHEWVPTGQDGKQYQEILVAQAHPKRAAGAAALQLQGMVQGASLRCKSSFSTKPRIQVENGYTATYAQIFCGQERDRDTGAVMIIKIIDGIDSIYIVQRELRVPASISPGDLVDKISKSGDGESFIKYVSDSELYLTKSVFICGVRSTKARCISWLK